MKFVDKLLSFLKSGFDNIIDAFYAFFQFLAKPLALIIAFFEGIFYFISKIFDVIVQIIMIFVAIFQFLGALLMGFFRTIKMWLTVSPSSDVNFPSVSNQGFATAMEIIQPTGLLTVVPMVALAFVWFYFILKMIGLFGGQIMIKPAGR